MLQLPVAGSQGTSSRSLQKAVAAKESAGMQQLLRPKYPAAGGQSLWNYSQQQVGFGTRLQQSPAKLMEPAGSRAWNFLRVPSSGGSLGKGPVLNSSTDLELAKAHKSQPAMPQKMKGREYWPEDWGITRQQCLELWQILREDVITGDWDETGNVYQLVDIKIKPMTKGKGYGYALLKNADAPKEVNTMVSHAWSENALEFLEAICRSTNDEDVIFICAFSLYQCEDAAGPTIEQQLGDENPDHNPFQRVLLHIEKNGMKTPFWFKNRTKVETFADMLGLATLCMVYMPPVLDGVVYTFVSSAEKQHQGEQYVWAWGTIWPLFRLCGPFAILLFILWVSLKMILQYYPMYRGRMIVVPNRSSDLYARLWCVYEIFIARKLAVPNELANTMASAGQSNASEAHCASKADEYRIRQEIIAKLGEGGFKEIDDEIRQLTNQLNWGVFRMVCTWGFPIIVVGLAYYNMYDPHDCRLEFFGDTSGLFMIVIGLVLAYYKVFKAGQGISAAANLGLLALAQISLGILFEVLRILSDSKKARCKHKPSDEQPADELFFAFLFGFSKAARCGLFAASIFSLGSLAFTYVNQASRAFHRKPTQVLAFILFGVAYCVARATVLGKKRLPLENWSDPSQAFPETFDLITEFMAIFGCPLNGIWGASLWWGLTVDWDHISGENLDGEDDDSEDDNEESLTPVE